MESSPAVNTEVGEHSGGFGQSGSPLIASWREITCVPSEATAKDLEAIQKLPAHLNCDALDDAFFDSMTFPQLPNKAHRYLASGKILMLMSRFNGTKAEPNMQRITYSPSIECGGLEWRLLIFPAGNGTTSISAYLQCQSIAEGKGLMAHRGPTERVFPMLNDKLNQPFVRIPVVYSIVVFNPCQPWVNFHKRSMHAFTTRRPDHGFSRLVNGHVASIGVRDPQQRRPLLEMDQLGFICRFRIVVDPTDFLWEPTKRPEWDWNFACLRTGFRPIKGEPERLAYASNFITAVTIFCALPPFRRILYSACVEIDLVTIQKKSPMLVALVKLICDMRCVSDPAEPPSISQVLKQVELLCIQPLYGNDGSIKPLYAPWRCMIKTTNEVDVVQAQALILDVLCHELRDSPCLQKLTDLFDPRFFRLRISSSRHKNANGLSGVQDVFPSSISGFSKVFQWEIPRQYFSETTRKWTKNKTVVRLADKLQSQGDGGLGRYALFAIVMHEDDNLQSRRFRLLIRPGQYWLAITTDQKPYNCVTRLPPGLAVLSAGKSVYLAMYVREDIFENEVLQSSVTFSGLPESDFSIPDFVSKVEANECEEDENENENEAMSEDASSLGEDEQMTDITSSNVMDTREDAEPTATRHMRAEKPRSQEVTMLDYEFLGSGKFTGQVKQGLPHGRGLRLYTNGDKYSGEYCRGFRSGTGTQFFGNGDTYEGGWFADQMHGQGKMYSAGSGNTYVGGWVSGRQSGKFVLSGDRAEAIDNCLICFTNPKDRVLDPCGHVCACDVCLQKLKNCPVCRRRIVKTIRFHVV